MNIILKRNAGTSASWYQQYVRKSVHSALSRFSMAINQVSVFLSDENGPKGGKDKTCKLVIHTFTGEKIVIKDTRDDWSLAIQNVTKRSKHALARLMAKLRSSRPSRSRASYANDRFALEDLGAGQSA